MVRNIIAAQVHGLFDVSGFWHVLRCETVNVAVIVILTLSHDEIRLASLSCQFLYHEM